MSDEILKEMVTVVSHNVATGAVEAVEKRVVDVEREALGTAALTLTDAKIVEQIAAKRSRDAAYRAKEAERTAAQETAREVLNGFDAGAVYEAVARIQDTALRDALTDLTGAVHALAVLGGYGAAE